MQSKYFAYFIMESDSIFERLKKFLDATALTSSQFADAANIPRPTFSQLLSGRNKKVSDEIFRKLHEAFPQLSIPWLMFGEGAMLNSGYNIAGEEITPVISDGTISEMSAPDISNQNADNPNFTINPPENGNCGNLNVEKNDIQPAICIDTESIEAIQTIKKLAIEAWEKSKSTRRVVRITVFYDDSSYESFGPCGE